MPAKVMWLIKGLGLGGAERLLTLAAPHVDRSRFDLEAVFLLPWKTALVDELERVGVPTLCLNQRSPYDLRVIPRIVRLLKERKVDLLHTHLPYSGVVGRIAARIAGTPCVVYTEHNLQERHHRLTRFANQATAGLCDAIIAVSDEVRDSLLRGRLARAARARVLTIQNGVDVEEIRQAAATGSSVREEFSIPADGLIVGVVNVFRSQKRMDLWIQAAKLIAETEPRARFLIVGDGPTRDGLRALADRMQLNGRVTFTGLRHDAPRLMSAFDVFMLSSTHEGLPVAILEAMTLGRPVVATRVGGLPEVIEQGRHGFLVDAGDPAALADKVLFLLGHPELRQAMGQASRRQVEEHFGIQRMVEATQALYDELLSAHARGRVIRG